MRLRNTRSWVSMLAFGRLLACGAVLAMGTMGVGCGGGSGGGEATNNDLGDGSVPLSQMKSLPSENPQDGSVGKPTAGLTGYISSDDPSATYTIEDIPDHGRYSEIDFSALGPEALNRVIHRLRTELCSCGCTAMTIDMCLYDDPDCGAAPEHAAKIMLEEQRRGN